MLIIGIPQRTLKIKLVQIAKEEAVDLRGLASSSLVTVLHLATSGAAATR